MKKKKPLHGTAFCEIASRKKTVKQENRTVFYRHKGNCIWQGVRDETYKTSGDEWSEVIRRVIIGTKGESAKFHVRYFEIFPGGNSSLERHCHEHVVICVKGEGMVLTGKTKRKMKFMDTLYISPDTPHQLYNPFRNPFGFLCIVNAKRDRPKLIRTSRR